MSKCRYGVGVVVGETKVMVWWWSWGLLNPTCAAHLSHNNKRFVFTWAIPNEANDQNAHEGTNGASEKERRLLYVFTAVVLIPPLSTVLTINYGCFRGSRCILHYILFILREEMKDNVLKADIFGMDALSVTIRLSYIGESHVRHSTARSGKLKALSHSITQRIAGAARKPALATHYRADVSLWTHTIYRQGSESVWRAWVGSGRHPYSRILLGVFSSLFLFGLKYSCEDASFHYWRSLGSKDLWSVILAPKGIVMNILLRLDPASTRSS